ncbi:hypothetical protein GCM10025867_51440 (plasmid) [Frondihabitans sucicola]|uniref:DNA-binding protein n=1 Tax=Frondihabitans sucicola TaxID=1268041 RepID=A0ABN6Y6V3_9MICO|nr:hypothetical protein [Frondihabitans sucicola]BDZ52336.1 hypothetical protein GCM10025867_45770 [Frondihabitans sucicola]BDZ52903.1 hypothetical protein GCM10025867_51440 [Frondihabitans sucicola]
MTTAQGTILHTTTAPQARETITVTVKGKVDVISEYGQTCVDFRATDGVESFFVVAKSYPRPIAGDSLAADGDRLQLTGRFVGRWFEVDSALLVAQGSELVAA